nr:M20/M25/M40 family metallo-hydrolase [Halovivax asiaticus]
MNRASLDGSRTGFDPIEFLERAVSIETHERVDELREDVRSILGAHGHDPTVDATGTLVVTRGSGEPAVGNTDRAVSHIVLNTHLDTVSPHVPPEWGPDGDRLSGRGACDAAGALAAMLATFLTTELTSGRLTLALTPDEEVYSTGARSLVERADSPLRDADAVIVGEPTGLDVCPAAPGRFEGTIELGGEHAHAARPDTGNNAVDALAEVLLALRSFDDRDDVPGDHPQLGAPTLTPTVVQGGEATNQVPASARLTVDRRPVPPETPDSFEATLLDQFDAAVPSSIDVSFSFTDRPTPFFDAWSTDPDHPLVLTLSAASGGDVRAFGAATEASYFAGVAPTVVFGPGSLADAVGPVAHADREYVSIDEIHEAATALISATTALLAT